MSEKKRGVYTRNLAQAAILEYFERLLRLSQRLCRDYAATMTGSHRRRIRREPDVFFAGNPAEILLKTARKNGRSISGNAERAKRAAKERLAERRIKADTRPLQAWQYRDSGAW